MKFVDRLLEEHRQIERALAILESAATRLDQGRDVPVRLLGDAIGFLAGYADERHHRKEEDAVFPVLAKHDFGADEPFINALKAHHQMGRSYVAYLQRDVDAFSRGEKEAPASLVGRIRAYIELLREHIRIEDEFFGHIARAALSAADDAEMIERFERIDAQTVTGEAAAQYERMLAAHEEVVASW